MALPGALSLVETRLEITTRANDSDDTPAVFAPGLLASPWSVLAAEPHNVRALIESRENRRTHEPTWPLFFPVTACCKN